VIHLHIGRNKAASTTLQDFCVEHQAELLSAGIRYLNFGHMAQNDPNTQGCATGEDLAGWVGTTGETVLVSNEFMFGWPPEYTWAMARALKGLPVQVHAYVRDYRTWLPSLYAQDVKLGEEGRDFESFADAMSPKVSAWPMLETWGEAVGWAALRVRTLDPRSLHGGTIVSDLIQALGVDLPQTRLASVPRRNTSPGWMELEVIRAARARFDDATWRAVGLPSAQTLATLMAETHTLAGERPEPPTRYMLVDRAGALGELYKGDLARISAHTGHDLPPVEPMSPPPHLSAPVLRQASPQLLRLWAAATRTPAFISQHPTAAALADDLIQDLARRATP